MLCFKKVSVAKKLMDKREGDVSRFSFENFLSHSTEKLCRGTLLCSTKFLVSKKFMDKRVGGEEGSITIFRKGVSQFSVEIFFSHSAENFRRENLLCCFKKISVAKKFMDKRGGGRRTIKIFRRKLFVSQCRKLS